MLGRNEEALRMLRERFAKPNIPEPLWLQYNEELNTDATRANFAIRLARRSLKRNPRNVDGLGALAANLWNAIHRDSAVAVQRLAASLGDKKESVAHTYFQMLIGLGRTQEGIDYLHNRATRLLDRSSAATLTYARALDQLHRSHDARETVRTALQQRPEDGDLLIYSAESEAAAGKTEEAFKLLEAASSYSGRSFWLRFNKPTPLPGARRRHVIVELLLKVIPRFGPFQIPFGRLPKQVCVQALARAGASIFVPIHNNSDPLPVLGNTI